MKILFFNYEYPPLGGGAANANFFIFKELTKIKNLEIDLITSAIGNDYTLERMGETIRIHRLPIGKNPSNFHFQSQKDILTYFVKAYFFGKKIIQEADRDGKKYDLSHSFFTIPGGLISLIFKVSYGLPYIISLRGSDVPGYNDRFGAIYFFLRPLIRIIWKKSAAVISNSQGLRELALKTSKDQKIDVIFNGVDTNDFCPNENLRRRDSFVITPGASRVTVRKGLRYLIEAVAILLPKHPNIVLRIMGDGDEKEKLIEMTKKNGLEKNVDFVGRIPREETVPYYQEASLFVLPSLNEGMSNAMLEALATGLPILATKTGGTDELVDDGKNGFIVEMKNPLSLAEKIEIIMQNDLLRMKMGKRSRDIAEKNNWWYVASQYVSWYEKIKNGEKNA